MVHVMAMEIAIQHYWIIAIEMLINRSLKTVCRISISSLLSLIDVFNQSVIDRMRYDNYNNIQNTREIMRKRNGTLYGWLFWLVRCIPSKNKIKIQHRPLGPRRNRWAARVFRHSFFAADRPSDYWLTAEV